MAFGEPKGPSGIGFRDSGTPSPGKTQLPSTASLTAEDLGFPDVAIGLIETASIVRGVVVVDAMVKRAPVEVLEARALSPGKHIVLVCAGVAEVAESMEAGRVAADETLIDELFLPQAHPQLAAALRAGHLSGPVESLGMIETYSVASTLWAADVACKAAEVRLVQMRLAAGIGGKGYFILTGPLFEVQAAVEAAVAATEPGLLLLREIIENPHEQLVERLS
jgi:microcompartment protein CcmL/EutN